MSIGIIGNGNELLFNDENGRGAALMSFGAEFFQHAVIGNIAGETGNRGGAEDGVFFVDFGSIVINSDIFRSLYRSFGFAFIGVGNASGKERGKE